MQSPSPDAAPTMTKDGILDELDRGGRPTGSAWVVDGKSDHGPPLDTLTATHLRRRQFLIARLRRKLVET